VQDICLRYDLRKVIFKHTAAVVTQTGKTVFMDEFVVEWVENFEVIAVECQGDKRMDGLAKDGLNLAIPV